ncbi:putative protein-serine/threonine phosphatase [Helianthus anomalus]
MVNDANKSFNGVCSRLEDMLEVCRHCFRNKDELVQLAFAAIQLVNSVFCSRRKSRITRRKYTSMYRRTSIS